VADPLEALRQPDVPLAPRASFAAELRRRLAAELDLPPGGQAMTTTPTTSAISPSWLPAGQHSITPYLCVDGGVRAIEFYRTAFGAIEESPALIGPDGRVGHAELRIGDSLIMLADEYPEMGVLSPTTIGGTPVQLDLYVEDADAVFAQAVSSGATVIQPVELQFYGSRRGVVQDPFGHKWFISTHVEDLTAEEFARRVDEGDYRLEPSAPPVGAEAGPPEADAATAERPSQDGQLWYFSLGMPDPARARDFFSALLGWQLQPAEVEGAYFIANLAPPGGLRPVEGGRPATLYFRVSDIQAAVAKVRELGGQADEPQEYPSGWSAECVDDQGTRFALGQPAPGYD
jgi:uncharacterized glyoxalase superfamily protein PhnB/catechol 2,3-dioxygenase-like lactoylglutathione lyase family enzyme